MTLESCDILKAGEDLRDDAGVLFFRFFLGNKDKDPGTGIAAFYLNQKPNILKGEDYAEFHWVLDGDRYVTNYSLYGLRMCLKYKAMPDYFTTPLFNTEAIINELKARKYGLAAKIERS